MQLPSVMAVLPSLLVSVLPLQHVVKRKLPAYHAK